MAHSRLAIHIPKQGDKEDLSNNSEIAITEADNDDEIHSPVLSRPFASRPAPLGGMPVGGVAAPPALARSRSAPNAPDHASSSPHQIAMKATANAVLSPQLSSATSSSKEALPPAAAAERRGRSASLAPNPPASFGAEGKSAYSGINRSNSGRITTTSTATGMASSEEGSHNGVELSWFTVLGTLGVGSFGRVRLGRVKGTLQTVALKFLGKTGRTERELDSWKREIEISGKLRNRGVVLTACALETRDCLVVVQECAQGDLFTVLRSDGRFPEHRCRDVCKQLVSALDYMHSNRVVHRDLKPQNILVFSRGRVALADFGFARAVSASTVLLTTIKGTPLYMAPEIIQERPYNHNADIWSLGIILYELLEGRPPFYAESLVLLVRKVVRRPLMMPRSACSDSFRSFLSGTLEKDPDTRLSWPKLREHSFVSEPSQHRVDHTERLLGDSEERPDATYGEIPYDESLDDRARLVSLLESRVNEQHPGGIANSPASSSQISQSSPSAGNWPHLSGSKEHAELLHGGSTSLSSSVYSMMSPLAAAALLHSPGRPRAPSTSSPSSAQHSTSVDQKGDPSQVNAWASGVPNIATNSVSSPVSMRGDGSSGGPAPTNSPAMNPAWAPPTVSTTQPLASLNASSSSSSLLSSSLGSSAFARHIYDIIKQISTEATTTSQGVSVNLAKLKSLELNQTLMHESSAGERVSQTYAKLVRFALECSSSLLETKSFNAVYELLRFTRKLMVEACENKLFLLTPVHVSTLIPFLESANPSIATQALKLVVATIRTTFGGTASGAAVDEAGLKLVESLLDSYELFTSLFQSCIVRSNEDVARYAVLTCATVVDLRVPPHLSRRLGRAAASTLLSSVSSALPSDASDAPPGTAIESLLRRLSVRDEDEEDRLARTRGVARVVAKTAHVSSSIADYVQSNQAAMQTLMRAAMHDGELAAMHALCAVVRTSTNLRESPAPSKHDALVAAAWTCIDSPHGQRDAKLVEASCRLLASTRAQEAVIEGVSSERLDSIATSYANSTVLVYHDEAEPREDARLLVLARAGLAVATSLRRWEALGSRKVVLHAGDSSSMALQNVALLVEANISASRNLSLEETTPPSESVRPQSLADRYWHLRSRVFHRSPNEVETARSRRETRRAVWALTRFVHFWLARWEETRSLSSPSKISSAWREALRLFVRALRDVDVSLSLIGTGCSVLSPPAAAHDSDEEEADELAVRQHVETTLMECIALMFTATPKCVKHFLDGSMTSAPKVTVGMKPFVLSHTATGVASSAFDVEGSSSAPKQSVAEMARFLRPLRGSAHRSAHEAWCFVVSELCATHASKLEYIMALIPNLRGDLLGEASDGNKHAMRALSYLSRSRVFVESGAPSDEGSLSLLTMCSAAVVDDPTNADAVRALGNIAHNLSDVSSVHVQEALSRAVPALVEICENLGHAYSPSHRSNASAALGNMVRHSPVLDATLVRLRAPDALMRNLVFQDQEDDASHLQARLAERRVVVFAIGSLGTRPACRARLVELNALETLALLKRRAAAAPPGTSSDPELMTFVARAEAKLLGS